MQRWPSLSQAKMCRVCSIKQAREGARLFAQESDVGVGVAHAVALVEYRVAPRHIEQHVRVLAQLLVACEDDARGARGGLLDELPRLRPRACSLSGPGVGCACLRDMGV